MDISMHCEWFLGRIFVRYGRSAELFVSPGKACGIGVIIENTFRENLQQMDHARKTAAGRERGGIMGAAAVLSSVF